MLFYFMFPAGHRTSFMILTQCCRFHVLLTCIMWRPLGWMTAFVQSFTGDNKKIEGLWMLFHEIKVEVLVVYAQ